MSKIPIRNKSDQKLEIQLEPWLDLISLEPGEEAELCGDFGDGLASLEIDYWSEGFLSVWVPAGTTIKPRECGGEEAASEAR
jgi:hypothetical protein